jgi:pyrroloquinoline-quinone synthase
MPTMMSKAEFIRALEAARSVKHSQQHPWTRLWADGRLSRQQLGAWARQHFYYIDPIPHLMENLLGEEMPHAPEKRHPDLLRKFARAAGVSDDDMFATEERGEVLAATRAMRAWIWELVSVRTIAEACAGIMVALEGQLPTLFPRLVDVMRSSGFSDDDLEFFHVHIVHDVEHAHVGLELAARYADTPALQAKAIAAVHGSTQLRYGMLDDIHEAFAVRRAA